MSTEKINSIIANLARYVGQKGSGCCPQQGLGKPGKLDKIKEELTQLFNDNRVGEAVLTNGINSGVMTPIPGYGKFRLFYRNEAGETAELIATLDECIEVFVGRFN